MPQRTSIKGSGGGGPKKPRDDGWEEKQKDDNPVIDARELVAEEDDDLGLSPDEEAFIPDPTGFEAEGPVHNIAGRDMIQLDRKQLSDLHYAHAGNASMVPDPNKDLSDRPLPDPDKFKQEDLKGPQPQNAQQRAAQTAAEKETLADEVMGGFTSNSQVPEPPPIQQPHQGVAPPQQPGSKEPGIAVAPGEEQEAVQVLEAVVLRSQKARDEGDIRLANELSTMAQKIIEGTHLKRVQPQKETHPTASKLLEAFGLQKIGSEEIPWMGFKWMFRARPPTLDFWITTHSGANNTDLNAALVSSTVVAIDGDPVWKVFNIPLTASYKVEGTTLLEGMEPDEAAIDVQVYRKTCDSCSCEVTIDTDTCPTCGASVDPFDVPIELRFKYAETVFRFITEKLGLDFADLQELVSLYRKSMKDRMFDKEELYPLLQLSKTQDEKTPG
jgi:hypothetical protein